MRGCGERRHCGLVTRKLAIDRLCQGARDVQRAVFDKRALAIMRVADQQGSTDRCRNHRCGDKANELAPNRHVLGTCFRRNAIVQLVQQLPRRERLAQNDVCAGLQRHGEVIGLLRTFPAGDDHDPHPRAA